MQYVVDASVVVKWYDQKKEENIEQALKVFQNFKEGKITLIAPKLLYYEFLNALIVGKKMPAGKVQRFFKNLFLLSLVVEEKENLLIIACEIAEKFKITIYDAVYVALAKKHNCQLISANPRHHGKIKDNSIINLKDFYC